MGNNGICYFNYFFCSISLELQCKFSNPCFVFLRDNPLCLNIPFSEKVLTISNHLNAFRQTKRPTPFPPISNL